MENSTSLTNTPTQNSRAREHMKNTRETKKNCGPHKKTRETNKTENLDYGVRGPRGDSVDIMRT